MSKVCELFLPGQLIAARTAAGLDAQAAARALGCSPARLQALEAGEARPTVDELLAMTEALDVELGFLYEGFRGTVLEGLVAPGNERLVRPLDAELVQRLHTAVDRGQVTARKAALLAGLTLDELAAVFPAHGLPLPFDL